MQKRLLVRKSKRKPIKNQAPTCTVARRREGSLTIAGTATKSCKIDKNYSEIKLSLRLMFSANKNTNINTFDVPVLKNLVFKSARRKFFFGIYFILPIEFTPRVA